MRRLTGWILALLVAGAVFVYLVQRGESGLPRLTLPAPSGSPANDASPSTLPPPSLWAGVVAGYDVLATDWRADADGPEPKLDAFDRRYLRLLSLNAHLSDLRGRPLQPHHGTADKDVPYSFQVTLANDLRAAGQPHGLFATRATTTTSAAIWGWRCGARCSFSRKTSEAGPRRRASLRSCRCNFPVRNRCRLPLPSSGPS